MGFLIWIVVLGIIIYTVSKGNNKKQQQTYTQQQRPVQQSYVQQQRPVQQTYVQQQRPVKQDIMGKAMANNARLAEDRALQEIEQMHGHREKAEKTMVEHSRTCQTLVADSDTILASESILGSVDDLMVKGYSGDLKFERDFLAEAMDMLNSF